jgi:prepilin-type N-terminal cleavage/methylation domain-containing protein
LAPTNERGFTLIEVLIAMVILTIALVAMAELMAITLRIQMLGRNETASVRLVQSKIDQLVAVNFTNATVAIGGSLSSDVTNYNDTPTAGYKRRWQIAAIAGETRVRTLTVTVIPDVKDNRTTRSVQLTTIIRDP